MLAFPACKSDSGLSQTGGKTNLSLEQKRQLDINFFEAIKERDKGNYDLAANHFMKVLGIDPFHASSHYELATIREIQGLPGEALKLSNKAANIDPSNVWYKLQLAHLYEVVGMTKEASDTYEKIVKQNPDKGEYYFEWASSLLNSGELEKAIEVYDMIESKMGIAEELSINKYQIYYRLKKREKAEEELQKLIQQYPGESKYLGLLAEFYEDIGEAEKALSTYEQILEQDPENPVVHLSLSEYYRQRNDNDRAQSHMLKAFQNPGLDIDTKVQILLNLYYPDTPEGSDNVEKAWPLLDAMVATHNKEAKAWSIYGDFLFQAKRLEEAREKYRTAIVFDKSKFVIWDFILRIDAELGDFTALLEESEESIDLFPSQPAFYLYNGISRIQKKQYDEAVDVLNSGKVLVVENNRLLAEFYSKLGDVYHQTSNFDKSDDSYERVLKLTPNNALVLNNYSYYLSLREKDLEKAERMSLRCNELEPGIASYQDTYGWILYQMGNYKEAEKWLRKALDSDGERNYVILEHFGDVQFRLKNTDSAVQYWNKAQEAGADSETLQKKIAERQLNE